jgi:hypothetical protein
MSDNNAHCKNDAWKRTVLGAPLRAHTQKLPFEGLEVGMLAARSAGTPNITARGRITFTACTVSFVNLAKYN